MNDIDGREVSLEKYRYGSCSQSPQLLNVVSDDAHVITITLPQWTTESVVSRVVSPEEFIPIFPDNYRNNFTGNFLPLQTFQITVYLLTMALFKVFYSTCRL